MTLRDPRRPSAVRRRSLLGGTLAVAAAQTACSSDSPERTDPSAQPSASSTAGSGSRVLVAYFSRAGENYFYGGRIDLEVGNTEVLAGIIGRRLREHGVDHDIHRIDPADPYPHDYDATVARNVREQEADARPEIADMLDSIDGYDVVLLGSPIWNVRPPMIMHTFAESHDFTGRVVHPVTTHAMSGLGSTEREYTDACRGATIGEGLAVQGEEVRDAGPPAVASWLPRIGLTGGDQD